MARNSSHIVEATDADKNPPPDVVAAIFAPWSEDLDAGEGRLEGLESQLRRMELNRETQPEQPARSRQANAQLPRPLEDAFYAIFVGRRLGVVSNQWEAEAAVRNIPNGFYDSYPSYDDALANFRAAEQQGATSIRGTAAPTRGGLSGRSATYVEGPTRVSTVPIPRPASPALPLDEEPCIDLCPPSPDSPQPSVRFDLPERTRGAGASLETPGPSQSAPVQSQPGEPRRLTGKWSKRVCSNLAECHGFERGNPVPSATWDQFKAYAVVKGGKPGIHESWDDCTRYVKGYPGAVHKSYRVYRDAVDYFLDQFEKGEVTLIERV
ncbi:hypothetical protein BV25DRAFT_1843441 [Artomyces pyxidatus]|uniref:Uncharacterized protein n=1 Tax=Artomyces pyxidatus TaxID=48021 RepID=A0ACB8SFS0_9AGAM|nr:hypothetical protein BV25DRAFT_1843441 [Artomyces pyxidatus]